MPEGPEVRIVAETLHRTYAGQYLRGIVVDPTSRYVKKPLEGLDATPFPLLCTNIHVKGKKIFFCFDQDVTMVSFLGMEGKWLFEEAEHTSLTMYWSSSNCSEDVGKLFFDDIRHFGFLQILRTPGDVTEAKAELGPDLLNEEVSLATFVAAFNKPRMKKSTKMVAVFLLEQQHLSGIGNYLRSEILYLAKINPWRTLDTLSEDDLYQLWQFSIRTIKESYDAGGLTIRTYLSPDRKPGSYAVKIYYNKKDELGHDVVRESDKNNRAVWWCPQCQK